MVIQGGRWKKQSGWMSPQVMQIRPRQSWIKHMTLNDWPNKWKSCAPCQIQPLPEEWKRNASYNPNNGCDSWEASKYRLPDTLQKCVPIGNWGETGWYCEVWLITLEQKWLHKLYHCPDSTQSCMLMQVRWQQKKQGVGITSPKSSQTALASVRQSP